MGFVCLGSLGPGVFDFSEAIESVARRLQRPAAFVDAEGYDDEIVAAAANAGGERFAWLQCRSKDFGRHVEVNFRLYVCAGQQTPIEWEPKSYNPFFGVNPLVLEWTDNDCLIFVYCEKHHAYRATFDRDGQLQLDREVANGQFIPEDEALREDVRRRLEFEDRRKAEERGRAERREWWGMILVALLAIAILAAFILFDQLSGNAQRR